MYRPDEWCLWGLVSDETVRRDTGVMMERRSIDDCFVSLSTPVPGTSNESAIEMVTFSGSSITSPASRTDSDEAVTASIYIEGKWKKYQ